MPDERDMALLRHRAEMPLIYASFGITMLAAILALLATFSEEGQAIVAGSELADEISSALLIAPFMPLFILGSKYFAAAKARANGVKVGPDQFPELHSLYLKIARALEMEWVPELYVVNGNGVVNAYALSCNTRRNYVVLHAEIACLIERSPQVVEFVLAHELGHHKLKHVSLFRILLQIVPGFLVLPQRALSRAQEYSADRVAVHACGTCSSSIGLLAVGPLLEHRVNHEAFLAQAAAEERSVFVRLVHWLSSHAVNTKRLQAISQIEQFGFGRHGRLF